MSASRVSKAALPTGTVTFLFTDIEGSTRLLSQLGDLYQPLLEEHASILREAISSHGGVEVNTEGDAFFAVFSSPADGLAAAVAAQKALAAADWPDGRDVRVRMGLHSGEGRLGGDDYIGMDVHRAARIASAAHGGQILVSEATKALIDPGTGATELRDLGSHQLKDLDAPERIYQLVIPGLPGDFPPPKARRRGNIPESSNSFIGREDVVARIKELVGESRLVTITGPGGAGKTRLSLEVAGLLADELPDGAYFVALETIHEPDLLLGAIASSLGLAVGEEGPRDAVKSHLEGLELLLVLDNFEQIAAAADDVGELMQEAPKIRVLATSRAPLRLYGEQEYPTPPLSAPDPRHLPPAQELEGYEAVALFVARARASKPRFAIDDGNVHAVSELISRLDGLPLAIELAAARIRLLTPQAMLDRIEKRLDLLSSSARDLPARQRTLRGAIDWSYDLLGPEERQVFERIGVFEGGFGLEVAEELVSPDGECGIDIIDALGSLVEKSLIVQTDLDGEPRFHQLESIREYAGQRLAERGEADLMHRRLADHVVELVEAAERFLDRSDDHVWFARLEREQDDLRAALRWSIASRKVELAERIVAASWRYWMRKGLLAEGTWWTDQVLKLAGSASAHRAKALIAAGSLAYWRVDYPAADVAYASALEMYRSLGDEEGITNAAYNRGYAQFSLAEPDWVGAMGSFESALEGFRRAGDAAMIQSTLFILGFTQMEMGEIDRPEALFREAHAMQAGDVRPLTGLATIAYLRQDYAKAREYMRELVEMTRARPDLAFQIVQLERLVPIEIGAGDIELAMKLHGLAQELRQQIGGGPPHDRSIKIDPVAEARAAIGVEATAAAIEAGASLSADEAFALVFERA